jgi:integrase
MPASVIEVNLSLPRKNWNEKRRSGGLPATRVFAGLDPNNFRRRDWRRMLEHAGLRHVPIKALRHTFASLHIAHRESLAYVRGELGHSSIQVTVDVYGHLVPGGNRDAADRLDVVASPNAHPDAPPAARVALSTKPPKGIEPSTYRLRNRPEGE